MTKEFCEVTNTDVLYLSAALVREVSSKSGIKLGSYIQLEANCLWGTQGRTLPSGHGA